MRAWAAVKLALRALRRNKLRSVLTTLGMIIGVGAVIAMVGIGNGAKAQVEDQIASMGRDVVIVFSGSFSRSGIHSGWGGAGTLTIDDAIAIEREIRDVAAVSPEVRSSSQVSAGNQNWFTQVLGEGVDYLQIRQWPLASGQLFTEQDVRSANKVAVIGRTTAQQLFGDEDPVGQVVRIRNVPFTIVGQLVPKGMSAMGPDQDDVLVVPYTTAMKRLLRQTTLRSMLIQARSTEALGPVATQVTELLRERHRITPGKDDDFTVRNQQEITEMATAMAKTMTTLLGAIAGVSLVVGGIGIMNIMLVSVTERTREIGIRLAVGARRRDILLQFLIEAATLSSTGGLLGIAAGVGAAQVLAWKAGWPVLVSTQSVLVAFVVSAGVGIFFGFYPARKASRLDPIEALRYE